MDSRKGNGGWWPWLHMTPLEFPDLLWEVVVLGPQVSRCVRSITGEKGGPKRLKELPSAT